MPSRTVPSLEEGEVEESKTNAQLPPHLPFSSKKVLRETIADHFHASSLTSICSQSFDPQAEILSSIVSFLQQSHLKIQSSYVAYSRQNFQNEDISLEMKARAEELAKQSQVQ